MPYQSFQAPNGGKHPAISLPAGQRIYAIGDIHGDLSLLERLQAMISADICENPAKKYCVIYLGDYVDRGTESRQVIERLSTFRIDQVDHIFLKGNHEAFLADFLEHGENGDAWLLNGGEYTLKSYGIDPALFDDVWDYHDAADALRAIMPDHHKKFLYDLELSHREGSLFFAHAGINPDNPLDQQRPKDLMWIRDKFLNAKIELGAFIIHGHTPRNAPEVTPFRINVDTHAWSSGHLTTVVLENGHFRFLNT